MLGALIVVAIVVVVLPVAVMMSGVVVAAVLGYSLKDASATDHEGSELLPLS